MMWLYCEAEGIGAGGVHVREGRQVRDGRMVETLLAMKEAMEDLGIEDIRTYWQYWDEVTSSPMYSRHEVLV